MPQLGVAVKEKPPFGPEMDISILERKTDLKVNIY